MKPVTAIFDIGKTHKKLVLFDSDLRLVYEEERRFDELKDDDGFPCDDIEGILTWIDKMLLNLVQQNQFDLQKINFTTYGASWVHINADGDRVAPLYNYLKPFPEKLQQQFDQSFGIDKVAFDCASPYAGMLNSGLQLYWLKHEKATVFSQIDSSLHFPQYLSFIFGGEPHTEYTSLGCHTALWDFKKQQYHDWVKQEHLVPLFPPLSDRQRLLETVLHGKTVKIGMGIHDSSASLLPYIEGSTDPFLLLSTGTWSVALNPFSKEALDRKAFDQGALCYMLPNGKSVRASRLFLGHEYELQERKLARHFGLAPENMRTVSFDVDTYQKVKSRSDRLFQFETLNTDVTQETVSLEKGLTLIEAYHQLIWELVNVQLKSLLLAKGTTEVSILYIEGGFAKNEVFVHMLATELHQLRTFTAKAPFGTSLGAALAVSENPLPNDFLQKHYSVKAV